MTAGRTQANTDVLWLTATATQARVLRERLNDDRLRIGGTVWQTPTVMTWSAWLQSLWTIVRETDVDAPPLLTSAQSRHLWEHVIITHAGSRNHAGLGSAARLCEAAVRSITEWGLPYPFPGPGSEDLDAFSAWYARYLRSLQRGGWIVSAQLPSALMARRDAWRTALPARIVHAGLGRWSSGQATFVGYLESAGVQVGSHASALPTSCARVAVADRRVGWRVAARWAQLRVTEGLNRVAIAVPDDELGSSALMQTLDREWPAIPWRLARRKPVSDTPIGHIALRLLELTRERFDYAVLETAMRSPYLWGGHATLSARAAGEQRLRRGAAHEVSRRWATEALSRLGARISCPVRLPEAAARGRRTASAWVEWFVSVLGAAGWPGDARRDPASQAALTGWGDALIALGKLDAILPEMNHAAALSALRRALSEARIEDDHGSRQESARVTVLAWKDAAIGAFDALWVCGLSAEAWPGPVDAFPFIPRRVAEQHGVPGSGSEIVRQDAAAITKAWCSAARTVVLCAPETVEEERVRPSALIPPDIPDATQELKALFAPRAQIASQLEVIEDHPATPLPDGVELRHGAALFEDQAQCPFRAFAHARLGVSEADDPVSGFDSRERGSLLHLTLARVWKDLVDHATLIAQWPRGQRHPGLALVKGVMHAATATLDDFYMQRQARAGTDSPFNRRAECRRLTRQVIPWLAIERERLPFRVTGMEETVSATIGGVHLPKLRLDRTDTLEAGGIAIIDYKSGKPQCGWNGDRPRTPQLPLYAMASREPPAALMLVGLKPGDMKCLGESRVALAEPGTARKHIAVQVLSEGDWDARLAAWRATLDHLGEALRSGQAPVDPIDRGCCEYCDVSALCRIFEREGLDPFPDEEEVNHDG